MRDVIFLLTWKLNISPQVQMYYNKGCSPTCYFGKVCLGVKYFDDDSDWSVWCAAKVTGLWLRFN